MNRTVRPVTALGAAALLLAAGVGPARPQQVEVMRKEAETPVSRGKTAVKRVATAPAPRSAAPAVPVEASVIDKDQKAQQDALREQFTGQVRPILRAELHLIRAICSPSGEDRAALVKEGEEALKEVVEEITEAHWQGRRGVGEPMPNAPEVIQNALAAAVSARLTPGQAERYLAETEARTKWERSAAARGLVARFDRLLNLSPAQRDKIAAALEKANGLVVQSSYYLLQDADYFPVVSDPLVVRFLDDRQKTIWQGVRKVRLSGPRIGIAGINLSEQDLAEEDGLKAVGEAARRETW